VLNLPTAAIAIFTFNIVLAFPCSSAPLPASSDAGGVLSRLTLASFSGSGQNSIQSVATDSSGNLYVAGATSSFDFATLNAAQPVIGESRILRSTDLGVTWTHMGLPPSDVTVVVPDPVNALVIFAAGNAGIFKSTDGGQSWTTVYPFPSPASFAGGLVIDPGNHQRLAAFVNGAYIRSLDGGNTWTKGASCANCGGTLIVDPTGSGALISGSFGLYISRDWALTFQQLYQGGGNLAAFDPSNPGWIYLDWSVGVFGNLVLSKDFGTTWTPKASPMTTFSAMQGLKVDPNQPNVLVAATPSGFYKSSDGATTWTLQSVAGGIPGFSPGINNSFLLVNHACSPGGGMFALGNQDIAFSPDDGTSWTKPHLTGVNSVAMGPGCVAYVTRLASTDAFVAKISSDGTVQWATYWGGSDQDVPVALAVDAQGNAYVTGSTWSPDFPTTVPLIGVPGTSSVFVTKFTPDGKIAYSAILSGEASTGASALSVDVSGNVYVAGGTNSTSFPVTAGVLGTSLAANSSTGFLTKLSSAATLLYSTYLGTAFTSPAAIVVDPNGQVIVAGTGPGPGLGTPPAPENAPAFVVKLNQSASQVVSGVYLPIVNQDSVPRAVAMDANGNVLLFGTTDVGSNFTATSGAYASPAPITYCTTNEFDVPGFGDAFLLKLNGSTFQTIYAAQLGAPCGIDTGAIVVDPSGAAVLALQTGAGLALQNPLVAGPGCESNSSAIAKISADGSTLQFATYLDSCGTPGIALGANGSIYAGVSSNLPGSSVAVLNISPPPPSAISINQISNAFSGDQSAVVVGGLYTLTGTGFQPSSMDLGFTPAANLPSQLGGVKVLFDGVPASVLEVAPGRVIVATPEKLIAPSRGSVPPNFTSVRISYNGSLSSPVWMPVSASAPGFLTTGGLNPSSVSADGYVQNQDGTLNSATNPAAVGSTIALFATGMGATTHPVIPGSLAQSTSISPGVPVYMSWQQFAPGNPTAPLTVESIPGYLSSVFQVLTQVPASALSNGQSIGNGVARASIYLMFREAISDVPPPASNEVGIYVK